ncbi:MAG: transforming growth factor-beta-induced protein [Planctomycetota bacterium]|jgi:transforming growth factor-beta-induced protein
MKSFTLLSLVASASVCASAAIGASLPDSCSSSSEIAATEKKDIIDTAVGAGTFKTLAAALTSAELVGALKGKGPFTVFAPSDAAFAKLPKGTVESLLKPENRATLTNILTYHVVQSKVAAKDVVKLKEATALNGQRIAIHTSDAGVSVAGSKVVTTDIECSNGIIHVIDTVMMPATSDLVATAVEAGTFKTLTAALGAAGLVKALQGPGPFTVFAPSDAAFAKLPAGTVESLLLPENRDQLISILKFHVVPGRVYANQLKSGLVSTIGESSLSVRVTKAGAFIGTSKVATADIQTTNGVIHVIDSVLIPE